MKEINEIINAYEVARQKGQRSALATVVHVDGSAYRRPGARMLVTDDGRLTGAISGGCLEGDALRKAQLALSRQTSMVVTYDTTDEDDAKLGMGLGCNGIIQVLFEPIDPENPDNPIELLKQVAGERQPAVLVTVFSLASKRSAQPGTCLLMKEAVRWDTFNGDERLKATLLADGEEALVRRQSAFKNYIGKEQDLTAFIEFVQPVISLVIFGAGNDIIPLVKMADILGWQTTVVDGRPGLARPERFVPSCQVLVSKPEKALEKIAIDEETVFVLMTHNYVYDLAVLRNLITRKVRYIGSLGPKKKADRMLNELMEEGIPIGEDQLKVIYGPSGLDIGAETPEEIALSILAEIKAALSNRQGGALRDGDAVIHPRTDTRIEKVNLLK